MKEEGLKIAFLVTDFFSNEDKSDPDFFFWEVSLVTADGNMNEIKQKVEIHRC
jgi:hypothetical protein